MLQLRVGIRRSVPNLPVSQTDERRNGQSCQITSESKKRTSEFLVKFLFQIRCGVGASPKTLARNCFRRSYSQPCFDDFHLSTSSHCPRNYIYYESKQTVVQPCTEFPRKNVLKGSTLSSPYLPWALINIPLLQFFLAFVLK